MRIGGIDPAAEAFSFGVVDTDRGLIDAGMRPITMLHEACDFVRELKLDWLTIEQPQVYVGRKNKGDANDLIRLANVVGACAAGGVGARVRLITPNRWKGQMPKPVHHRLMRSKLNVSEKALLAKLVSDVPEGKRHNVFDAVCLALWAAGRMGNDG